MRLLLQASWEFHSLCMITDAGYARRSGLVVNRVTRIRCVCTLDPLLIHASCPPLWSFTLPRMRIADAGYGSWSGITIPQPSGTAMPEEADYVSTKSLSCMHQQGDSSVDRTSCPPFWSFTLLDLGALNQHIKIPQPSHTSAARV